MLVGEGTSGTQIFFSNFTIVAGRQFCVIHLPRVPQERAQRLDDQVTQQFFTVLTQTCFCVSGTNLTSKIKPITFLTKLPEY